MICVHAGCERHASYGAPDTRNRTACATHKAAHHVYLIGQLCAFANGTRMACGSRGAYGFTGADERWCRRHKKAGMLHMLSRKCQDKDCSKQPIFGVLNTSTPLFCREHKSAVHVDVVNRRCQKCDRQGVFGDPIAHRNITRVNRRRFWRRRGLPPLAPLFCREHRQDGHCNLLSKKCRAEGCSKQPYFGDPVARIPLWCNQHKPLGHEDVKNRRCCHPHGCTRHPAYGDPGGIAAYCLQHKAPSHIPLIGYRCDRAVCVCNSLPAAIAVCRLIASTSCGLWLPRTPSAVRDSVRATSMLARGFSALTT